jgi:hypothetical protein
MGNLLWNQTFGGYDTDRAHAVTRIGNNIFVIGLTHSFGEGPVNMYLLCLREDGTFLWSRRYGANDTVLSGESIIPLGNGDLLIAGGIGYLDADVNDSIFLMRIDDDGNQIWNNTYRSSHGSRYSWAIGTGGGHAGMIAECVDGGFALISSMVTPATAHHVSNMDAWLLRTDSSGTHLWNRTYPCIGEYDGGISVVECNNSDFLLLFQYDDRPWLMRTDSAGNPLWNMTLGYQYHPQANKLIGCDDGGYLIVGWVFVEREEPRPEGGTQIVLEGDMWLLRMGYDSLPPQPFPGLSPELVMIVAALAVSGIIIGVVVFFVLRRRRISD